MLRGTNSRFKREREKRPLTIGGTESRTIGKKSIENSRSIGKPFLRGVLVVVVFMFIVLSSVVELRAMISSRIEGVVVDKATGKPIAGARVYLFYGKKVGNEIRYREDYKKMVTDSEGRFKYDFAGSGKKSSRKWNYFINVFREGYASRGVFMHEEEILKTGVADDSVKTQGFLFVNKKGEIIFKPKEWDEKIPYISKDVEEVFGKGKVRIDYIPVKIGEGEIKHLKIGMDKESVVRIELRQKFPGEGEKALNVDYINYGSVYLYHNKYGNSLNVSDKVNYKGGVYEIRELRSGRVGVGIDIPGYPSKWERFYLKKGETKVVRFVADFTKGQVVRWRMIDKNTGKPYLMNVDVFHAFNGQKHWPAQALIDDNNICWIYFPEPGRYKVDYSFTRKGKGYHITEIITVKPGEKKYIEKRF